MKYYELKWLCRVCFCDVMYIESTWHVHVYIYIYI